jgi:hypothetical protein
LRLGEDLIFGMCLGVNAIALVLNVKFKKLGWLEWRWLGGIYSLQPLPSHWLSLLSMGTQDRAPFTVRCMPRQHAVGFGAIDHWNPLSCSCTGQYGVS